MQRNARASDRRRRTNTVHGRRDVLRLASRIPPTADVVRVNKKKERKKTENSSRLLYDNPYR